MRATLTIAVTFTGLFLACTSHAQERFTGVGVGLGVENHAIKIMTVIPNTPASKAGLSAGLVVQKIDGTVADGKHLKECVDMLRGAVGTKVKLELIDTAHSKTNRVELVRAEIKVSTMQSSELVKVARISGNTNGEDVEKRILEMLYQEGIPCSVVDSYVIAGSFKDDISVPADKQAEAVQLLKQDAEIHKYDITLY
jgi:predicted metalloprotease with PDZ domain